MLQPPALPSKVAAANGTTWGGGKDRPTALSH
jgi:hypothetical protein